MSVPLRKRSWELGVGIELKSGKEICWQMQGVGRSLSSLSKLVGVGGRAIVGVGVGLGVGI